jgi:hypothetical protein
MSYVIATPEFMTSAATDLATIGATIQAAHMAAATPTLAVLPAAADEVSASIAHLFSGYGEEYQKLAGQAATFPERFIEHLHAAVGAYASAEAANASSFAAASSGQELFGPGWWQFVDELAALRASSPFYNAVISTIGALLYFATIFVFEILFILFVPGFFTDYFLPAIL